MVEFYLKLRLILRMITYLTYICWEIDNFVIKSDIFRRFFICKNILKKLSVTMTTTLDDDDDDDDDDDFIDPSLV